VVHKPLDESNQRSVDRERERELANIDVPILGPRRILAIDGAPGSSKEPLAYSARKQTAENADWQEDDLGHSKYMLPPTATRQPRVTMTSELVRYDLDGPLALSNCSQRMCESGSTGPFRSGSMRSRSL
jgi:hypothetical protein